MVTITKDATAREIVDAINEWAKRANALESAFLWDFLTALRGPDNPVQDCMKGLTTAVFRRPLANLADRGGGIVEQDLPLTVSEEFLQTCANQTFDHFLNHAVQASRALRVMGYK